MAAASAIQVGARGDASSFTPVPGEPVRLEDFGSDYEVMYQEMRAGMKVTHSKRLTGTTDRIAINMTWDPRYSGQPVTIQTIFYLHPDGELPRMLMMSARSFLVVYLVGVLILTGKLAVKDYMPLAEGATREYSVRALLNRTGIDGKNAHIAKMRLILTGGCCWSCCTFPYDKEVCKAQVEYILDGNERIGEFGATRSFKYPATKQPMLFAVNEDLANRLVSDLQLG